jgi:hypothetical protein
MPDQQSALAEELSRGQVDEQPLSPVDEAKGKLGKLLNARPKEQDLVEVGTCIPEIRGRCASLMLLFDEQKNIMKGEWDTSLLDTSLISLVQTPRSHRRCKQPRPNSSDSSLAWVAITHVEGFY